MLELGAPKSRKRLLKSLIGIGAIIFVFATIIFLAFQLVKPLDATTPYSDKNAKKIAEITTNSIASKIMVVGDVFFSRYTNTAAIKSPLKYQYPFARLNEFHRDKYDAWVGDMECPVTDFPQPTAAEEEATLSFNCSDKYLPEMSKWFNAMTLANNHTDNRGQAGFTQTQSNLEQNGVQYFGSYDPEDYDNLCDIISLPARATESDGSTKTVKLPIAFCGYHGVFQIPTARSVDEISKYSPYLPVVAMPHSGAEYQPAPDKIKTTLYRSMIDAGADVVIGDHPHWVQTTEAYNGHLILYSLGNFMFDQQFNSEVTRSVGLVMDVQTSAQSQDLDKWAALADDCTTYHDSCLDKAREEKLVPLKLDYHFSIVGTDNLGRQTHPATTAQEVSLLKRLQWSQTIKGLSGQFSGS